MDDFDEGLTEIAAKMRTGDVSVLNAGTAGFVLRAAVRISELEEICKRALARIKNLETDY